MNSAFPSASSAAIRRAKRWLRQRGFTLVELAIALAVVGLVLGASIIPLRALEEARQLQDEQRRMEVIRDAVVGYALRNRTRERTVRFEQNIRFGRTELFVLATNPESVREFRLPAGRPYLPCPDWDGDGFEDRVPDGVDGFAGVDGFVQGVEVMPGSKVTLAFTFDDSPNRSTDSLGWNNRVQDLTRSHGRYPYGECKIDRGSVPWRTLGIPPADGWGNRHTYYADPVFSNAIFGFDRQTIADIYDPRLPDAPGFGPAPRRSSSTGGIGDQASAPQRCAAAICDGLRSGDCAFHDGNASCSWRNWPHPPPATLILKAGAAAKGEIPGWKHFPAGGVTDGVPFVIVSHGPNGRFAVNHWTSLESPINALGAKRPICNSRDSRLRQESSVVVDIRNRDLAYEAVNGVRHSRGCHILGIDSERLPGGPPYFSWLSLQFNRSFFVWQPPGARHQGEFDDLLLWMTREELSLAVPGRIPPLPRMVVAVFP